MPCLGGTIGGKHLGQSGGRGNEGEMWTEAFIVVSLGRAGRGRVSRFRTGWLEELQPAWGAGAVPGCLIPGSGGIRSFNNVPGE